MELTIDQALQKGVEAHKAGQVQEAIAFIPLFLKLSQSILMRTIIWVYWLLVLVRLGSTSVLQDSTGG